MTTHAQLDTICKPSAHHFVPKKQVSSGMGNIDIVEVFCDKCGTVCFLSAQPDDSRVKLVKPS